ncbi:MAG: hypothetical protein VX447_03510 [Pseudomonadota bacterium]|uniref:hypothetical protein n=1 Tax=Gallaecimonas pentaromativorans TaxID=584787 RepID=UPI0012EDC82D|nr:hypothetical protein [Gallaecimonas pentaromativorans]MED5523806.1 hypothetical protein [Pseudomonadota bacterium]
MAIFQGIDFKELKKLQKKPCANLSAHASSISTFATFKQGLTVNTFTQKAILLVLVLVVVIIRQPRGVLLCKR